MKDLRLNCSKNNYNDNLKYSKTKENTNFNTLSNNNYLENGRINGERKKTVIMEFNQVKIPTYNQDESNKTNDKKYIALNSNSHNTKSTSNINLSNSQTKKDFNNLNNIYFFNSDKLKNDINKKYTQLDLVVIHSWNLPKGLKLHINKGKLDNSLRKENDGKVYFGFQEGLDTLKEKPFIDYSLMPKGNEYDGKYIGIHFQIRYDENNFKYFIKDLGSGYGTFIKLTDSLKIKNNLLINVGETFIVFIFNEDENNNNILLKIFTGKEENKIYKFNSDKKSNIIIGRDISNEVQIEDKMLSRKHCHIYFKKDEGEWYIQDGDLEGKKSTNDTWLYSFEDTLMYDQMIFKTNNIMFKCVFS